MIGLRWEKEITELSELEEKDVEMFPRNLGPYRRTVTACPGCDESIVFGIDVRKCSIDYNGERLNVDTIAVCPVCRHIYAFCGGRLIGSNQIAQKLFPVVLSTFTRLKK